MRGFQVIPAVIPCQPAGAPAQAGLTGKRSADCEPTTHPEASIRSIFDKCMTLSGMVTEGVARSNTLGWFSI